MKKVGALPDHMLRRFINAGYIQKAQLKNTKASTLELTMSGEVYRLDGVMLPRPKMLITQVRDSRGGIRQKFNSRGTCFFTRQVAYLARANESLALPPGVYGRANQTSTTGRLDLHVRLVVDATPRFDAVPRGYKGNLWFFIVARSFEVYASPGTTLMQLRLFNGDTRLGELELETEMAQEAILWSRRGEPYESEDLKITDHDGSCLLTLDVDAPVIGWRAKSHTPAINLAARNELPVDEYFEQIVAKGGLVRFLPNHFHIFSSAQYVRVPPHLACKMWPTDEGSGEFRAHYAGFIDPGWGYGPKGEGKGRPLTLEVRPNEPLVVGKGLPVAKIGFERLYDLPHKHYDAAKSSYGNQLGPRLARQFKTTAL